MRNQIVNYIKAGYPGLYIVSHEESRVEAIFKEVGEALTKAVGDETPFNLFAWSCTDGVRNLQTGEAENSVEPIEMLEHFIKAEQQSVYLLRDFHLFVEDKNPLVWRKLKDALVIAKSSNKALIIVGCRLCLPPELEKEITVVEFALPDRDQIRTVLKSLLEGNGKTLKDVEDLDGVLSAASGLTGIEAENAFSLSVVETGKVTKATVYREKCQIVKKNGLLEVVESKVTLDDIGGLAALKKWLLERRDAFTEAAKTYHLPTPKGFLAVGQPGTGKSLTAKACHKVFDVPLLKLDAGKLFGSLVGQSEQNWRTAFATAKAMAPVVFWIDEVDGAMSGGSSSGQTDGGTTSRVIKSILQDMQENSEGIFFVLTANDVDNLPSPLLRRMDEVWNVELPNVEERQQIWAIQIAKHKRKAVDFDVNTLAAKTEGYSGAEIEKLMVQAMYLAFADKHREPTAKDVLTVAETFMPLSKTMADDIEKRRKRLEGVAKLASGPAVKAPTNGRKLAGTTFKG